MLVIHGFNYWLDYDMNNAHLFRLKVSDDVNMRAPEAVRLNVLEFDDSRPGRNERSFDDLAGKSRTQNTEVFWKMPPEEIVVVSATIVTTPGAEFSFSTCGLMFIRPVTDRRIV